MPDSAARKVSGPEPARGDGVTFAGLLGNWPDKALANKSLPELAAGLAVLGALREQASMAVR